MVELLELWGKKTSKESKHVRLEAVFWPGLGCLSAGSAQMESSLESMVVYRSKENCILRVNEQTKRELRYLNASFTRHVS